MEKIQNTSYEYLYAAIQTAEWITPAYKKLAEKYKNTEALNELYLCICDNVKIELIEQISANDVSSEALANCRIQHKKELDFVKKYQELLEDITITVKNTQMEVKNLSSIICEHTVENTEESEVSFFIPEADEGEDKEEVLSFPEPDDAVLEEDSVPVSNVEHMPKEPLVIHKDTSVQSYLNIMKQRLKGLWNPLERLSKRTVVGMIEDGYNQEQITFLLQCMNEGMSEKEIDEISSPALSVEHMELLKKIKERQHGHR